MPEPKACKLVQKHLLKNESIQGYSTSPTGQKRPLLALTNML